MRAASCRREKGAAARRASRQGSLPQQETGGGGALHVAPNNERLTHWVGPCHAMPTGRHGVPPCGEPHWQISVFNPPLHSRGGSMSGPRPSLPRAHRAPSCSRPCTHRQRPSGTPAPAKRGANGGLWISCPNPMAGERPSLPRPIAYRVAEVGVEAVGQLHNASRNLVEHDGLGPPVALDHIHRRHLSACAEHTRERAARGMLSRLGGQSAGIGWALSARLECQLLFVESRKTET